MDGGILRCKQVATCVTDNIHMFLVAGGAWSGAVEAVLQVWAVFAINIFPT